MQVPTHRRQHPVAYAQQASLLLQREACRTSQGQTEDGAVDVDHELQFVPAYHRAKVAQVVLALLKLVRRHRVEAVQAIGDAGADGQVKRIEQVHAGAVVRQFFMLISATPGVEIDQQARHPSRSHHRDQGVVQRHQQAQGVDQRTPECVLAQHAKYPRQSLVQRQLFQQRVHALPLLSNP
ncbi:hypothetical protein D3C76_1206710 [compost metagenome]